MKIVAVTGTKGKTSIVNLVDFVLQRFRQETIKVNSIGVYRKGRLIFDNDYFLKKYKGSANVYGITELVKKKKLKRSNFVCLETAYSFSQYIDNFSAIKNKIDVSVVTNIYEDHIGMNNINNRKDLLNAKFSIVKNTKKQGVALINVDDLKKSWSHKILKMKPGQRFVLYCSDPNNRLLQKHVKKGGEAFAFDEKGNIFYYNQDRFKLGTFIDMPIAIGCCAKFLCANILASIATLYYLLNDKKMINMALFREIIQAMMKIKTSAEFNPGRLNFFTYDNRPTVMLDYAHEEESIKGIVKLARKVMNKKGKLIGVIRLSYYRDDGYIKKVSRKIAHLFDKIYIYDKAVSRRGKIKKIFLQKFDRKRPGEVADLMFETIKKSGFKDAQVIYKEFKAMKKAFKQAQKNDMIIFIGDQLEKDIRLLKKL